MDDPATRDALAATSLAAAPSHSREHQAERMLRVLELAAGRQGALTGTIEN
jgi:hypothetical protein